jgi:hypothetical protein
LSGRLKSNLKTPEMIAAVRYLYTDRLEFDQRSQSISRYRPLPGLKTYNWYSMLWSTSITDYEKVKCTGFVHVDDENTVVALTTKGKNTFWDDCIVKLNSKTGELKNVIPTVYPDQNEIFMLSKTYYDSQSEKIIAVGQLYVAGDRKVRRHATAILVYGKDGRLISSNKIEFPEHKIYFPRFYDGDEKAIRVLSIGKTLGDKYFVVIEDLCERTVGSSSQAAKSVDLYAPVAYSYFEIDQACNISNEKRIYVENLKGDVRTILPGRTMSTFVPIDVNFENKKTPYFVNFDKSTLSWEQTEAPFSTEFYQQFVIDSKHFITFQKFPKLDTYELKSILVK